MRVMIFTAVLLVAYFMTTDAWVYRRSNSDSSRRLIRWERPSPTFPRPRPGPTFPRPSPTFPRPTWRLKRSDDSNEPNLYDISLQVDPCNFMTYDVDQNGEVILGEFRAIFGESEMASDLFMKLDFDGTGAIEEEEFYQQAPAFIKACADLAADDDE